ncbi:MAG: phosphoribosyltransferase family protein, partial [Polyangiales bacterium]
VGHRLRDGDRVLIIEDVTTAGTSVRESVPLLRAAANVRIVGLVVAVDRLERGTDERSALTELAETYGMKAFALVTIDEIVQELRGRGASGREVLSDETHARLQAYRAQYGAAR